MLMIVFLVTVLANVEAMYRGLDFRNITQRIAPVLCPYTNFCHIKAAEEPSNGTINCCSPCSCEDDCYETKNCCPDKIGIFDIEDSVGGPVCKDRETKKGDRNQIERRRHLIYDTCPYGFETSYLNDKCTLVNQLVTNLTVEDLVWVTDVVSGKTYQNLHCAACHGVKSWVSWNVQTTCQEILNVDIEHAMEVLLKPECNIKNELPEEIKAIASKYICWAYSYSNCGTDKDSKEAETLSLACELFDLPYPYPFLEKAELLYKNIFCFICLKGQDQNLTSCGYKGDGIRSKSPSFTALIDMRVFSTYPSESVCKANEQFDKYLHVCRLIHCPFGQAPYNGQCKTLATTITGGDFHFPFKLEVLWDKTTYVTEVFKQEELVRLQHFIYTKFSKLLFFDRCLLCDFSSEMCMLKTKQNTTLPSNLQSINDVIFNVRISTDTNCDFNFLIENAFDIVEKEIKISIDGVKNISFLVSLENAPVSYTNCLSLHIPGEFIRCKSPYLMLLRKPCPEFHLAYSEVLSIDNTTKKEVFAPFFDKTREIAENTTVVVCIDQYFEAMEQAIGSSTTTLTLTFSNLAFFVFLMFNLK